MAHALHAAQVWTMFGISLHKWSGIPAGRRILIIACAEACHHLRCNFLKVYFAWETVATLSDPNTLPMSKLDQLVGPPGSPLAGLVQMF